MNPTTRLLSRSLEATLQFIRRQIEQNSIGRTLAEAHPFGSSLAVETLTSDVKLCTRVEVEFEDDDPIPGNHTCEVRVPGCSRPIRCRVTRRTISRPNGDLWEAVYDVAEEDC